MPGSFSNWLTLEQSTVTIEHQLGEVEDAAYHVSQRLLDIVRRSPPGSGFTTAVAA
jgi:hypothetical protein